ncbi:MAG: class I SAM-dependent methyltransferase [Bdellovibrionales bacterium]
MSELPECSCPVCKRACLPFDVVDFNKSCAEQKGVFLKLSGVPVYYYRCDGCGFCFAPSIAKWSLKEFEEKIYNDDYAVVDPHYLMKRPHQNHENLMCMFGKVSGRISHLDYGGGEGFLVKLLRASGWNSTSYDPFVNKDTKVADLGTFDLITAFEVFEHVPDVNALMSDLSRLLAPNGIVFFSTLLSDQYVHERERLTWWYASPRNGHISLFSKASLKLLANNHGLNYGNASNVFHFLWTTIPDWAQDLKPNNTEMPL